MIKILNKKFKPRIKARIRKNKQILGKNIDSFFQDLDKNSHNEITRLGKSDILN